MSGERIAITLVDAGWTWKDWAKVLAAAAFAMTVITLIAVLPVLLAG